MTKDYGRKGVKDAMAVDIGTDCFDYAPVSFEELCKVMSKHSDYLKTYFLKEGKSELSNKDRKLRERMLKKEKQGGRAKDPYERGRKAKR